jgi:hypothetical protein
MSRLINDDDMQLIEQFVSLHRTLYGIPRDGAEQPNGLGEEWSELKQRVYGTFAYSRDLSADVRKELGDPAVREQTLAYMRSKLPSLKDRVHWFALEQIARERRQETFA